MMNPKDIITAINSLKYEESSSVLEELISMHLRGKVYTADIKRHLEGELLESRYSGFLYYDSRNPEQALDRFIEVYGLWELVRLLTERMDCLNKML